MRDRTGDCSPPIEDVEGDIHVVVTRYTRSLSLFRRPSKVKVILPCSEGVEWLVMAEMRQISSEQMAAVVSHLHDNNRPVQPLGERELLLISD